MKNQNNVILFSGGGTLGSVMPLLGLYEDLNKKYFDYKYLWIGTKNGPEKKIINNYGNGLEYLSISSGKMRRYFDVQNFIDIFKILKGFIDSVKIIKEYRPKIILTAGGFVSVPLAFAAKIFNVPFFVHQQDYEVGLANKIMGKIASNVTVVLEKSINDYSFVKNKVLKTGNLVRKSLFDFNYDEAKKFFNINTDKKILLVTGGGTGAEFVNNLIFKNIENIIKNYEIIHLVGKDKIGEAELLSEKYNDYHFYELLGKEMKMALNISDVIISRAGFSALTEICALKKALVLIPLPGHQDLNAALFENKAIVHYQEKIDINNFINDLEKLSLEENLRKDIGEKIASVIEVGNDKYMKLVEEYL